MILPITPFIVAYVRGASVYRDVKFTCIIIQIKQFLKCLYKKAYVWKILCWRVWKYVCVATFHVVWSRNYYRKKYSRLYFKYENYTINADDIYVDISGNVQVRY